MPTLDLGPVVGPQGPQGETGPAGPQGVQGPAGPSATINGVPAVTITGGEKIQLEQAGADLTINCTARNPNLLRNWYFPDPVNQNGTTEYTTAANRCTIDGWKSRDSNGIITLTDDGLKLSGIRALIYQVYQRPAIGTALTYSALVKGPATIGFLGTTSVISTEGNDGSFELLTATITVAENFNGTTGLPMFLNNSGANVTGQPTEEDCWVKAVKLELGTEQTLARQNESGEWELIDPPDYDLQYTLCCQYSPITGEFVGSQQSNVQLLDNGNFFDPVNQKNESTYTSAKNGYFLDRWSFHNGGGSYDIATRTLTMVQKAYSGIYQRIESPQRFVGKRLTASFLYAADIPTQLQLVAIVNNTRTAIAYTEAPARETPECVSVSGIIPSGTTTLDVQLFNRSASSAPAGTAILGAAKLELGPVQTLAHKEGDTWVLNDPPPNKALELAKCQRYQSVLTANGNITLTTARCLSDGNITAALPIGPLRAAPANIANPTGLIAATDIFSGTTVPITAVTFIGYKPGEKMLTALLKCPDGTVGTIYRVGLLSGNSLIFDANL